MLGVHRDDFRIVLFGLSHHQLAGADQSFLVGKTNALAGTDGRQRGLQPHHAHHRRDDAVRLRNGGSTDQTLLAPGDLHGKVTGQLPQFIGSFLAGHHRQLGTVGAALLSHSFGIGAGGQGRHLQTKMGYDVKALPANRTGRA